MKRGIAMVTIAGLLLCAWPTGIMAATEEKAQAATEVSAQVEQTQAAKEVTKEETLPKDNLITTKHEAVIQGKKISYTAETGTVILESGGYDCEMFYTAYTRDDVKDAKDRPITFAFNGGPGASSYCIHFGCMGPRRPEIDDTGHAISLPAKIVDNENSILDMTDLVFIDPVGTGYSHALNEDETEEFLGYDNDRRSVGDFIRQYINRHKRWASPKYIAGESYGTTRSVGICEYLQDEYAIYVNGLMLVSSVNNFAGVFLSDGNDIPYALFIPTYAADAWYHGKLAKEYLDRELEDYLEEVRTFVEEEYVPALFLGKKMAKDEQDQIAQKLADYIGVSKDFVLKANLRIALEDFSTELLSEEKLMVGRYDGRITGPVVSGSPGDGENDPSASSTDIALFSTYQDYLTNELGFETDTPFIPLSMDVNIKWSYPEDGYLSQEKVVSDCMSKNPFLKVWVLCGYYDGATPFYSAEWVYAHVFLSEEREGNLSFTYYPSGHMLYMEKSSFDKFRKDAEDWYQK